MNKEENCGTCRFYEGVIMGVTMGAGDCYEFPTRVIKQDDDWCGRWKKPANRTKLIKPKIEEQQAVAETVTPIAPLPKTMAELTSLVADVMRTKKLTPAEIAGILAKQNLNNLQEIATSPKHIAEVADKIQEALNYAN